MLYIRWFFTLHINLCFSWPIFFHIILFIDWLWWTSSAWVFLQVWWDRGYFTSCGVGLLISAASLVAEHSLQGMRASEAAAQNSLAALPLRRTGSVVAELWKRGSAEHLRDLPGPGPTLCLLHWQADTLSLSYLGSPSWWTCCHFQHVTFKGCPEYWILVSWGS